MAGLGSRFQKEGYLLPKPLIPVSDKPMITQVINYLPKTERSIFIVRTEHINAFSIDRIINGAVTNATIIPIDYTTEGQATTCHLGIEDIEDDEEIIINSCDNSFLYNEAKFDALRTRPDVDSIVWTFTKDKLLTDKPEAWGWVKLSEDQETITDMSVKIPVSDNPFNDHAVVATFWFRRASDFKLAYKRMVEENYRINGEFYVDSLPIFMKKMGKKNIIFPVDLYVSWGKPADLHLYDLREFEYQIQKGTGFTDAKWRTFFEKNYEKIIRS